MPTRTHSRFGPRAGDAAADSASPQTATEAPILGESSSILALRPLVSAVRATPANAERLLSRAGVSPELLQDPAGRVPSSVFHALWRDAVVLTGDANLGLRAAACTDISAFDLLGYLGKTSATVGEALQRLCRYTSLVSSAIELSLEIDERSARVAYVMPLPVCRALADFRVALLVRFARVIPRRPLVPLEVELAHARPADVSGYISTFGFVPQFRSEHDAVTVSAADLDVPLEGAEERLCTILERQAEQVVAAFAPPDSFSSRVRRVLRSELTRGTVSFARVAESLGVSPRTLRRRLREEGTSPQELLDSLRHELALQYLGERRSISEVALLLGFGDSSAFSKAFRRWSGRSPRTAASTGRWTKS